MDGQDEERDEGWNKRQDLEEERGEKKAKLPCKTSRSR